MTINYTTGDATDPKSDDPKIIAHVCNDVGAWGAGFVLAVSKRWDLPERRYREWKRDRHAQDFGLGAVQLVWVEDDIVVANMIAQSGIRTTASDEPPIRYGAVATCLESVAKTALHLGAGVHMPRIGCGLAGGKWELIEPIINEKLISQGVSVTVYDLP